MVVEQMAQKQLNLTVAVKDGIIFKIEDVESGLKCGCVCPACGEPLVAKKGKRMMHHFAHHAGHNCEYGYESSLHLAAKDILANARRMTLPAVYVSFPDSYKKDELVCKPKEIQIDKVELERRFGDVIPDVVVYAGGKQFFVEIYVTHCIDDEKLAKLKKADISTIEIDLSRKCSITSMQELKDLLLGESAEKKWKYNSVSERYLHAFYKVADKREIVSRGYAMQVENCPIRSRVWRGKPYANYIDDCIYCKYCISSSHEGEMLCSGRQRIATVNDFKIPESQRIKDSNDEIDDHMESSFAAGTCPYCGGKLVERESRYGMFWGCKNYPHCRFIASVDPNTGEIIMKG